MRVLLRSLRLLRNSLHRDTVSRTVHLGQTFTTTDIPGRVPAVETELFFTNKFLHSVVVRRTMEDKETLKKRLTELQYHVTQEAGTERPFTGCYNKFYEEGLYVCIVCKQGLFSSKTKYDSGCGWPAFNDVLAKEKVTLHRDTSAGMTRTEVRCSKCSAHLGHVFDDGPAPTKKRFCINSASLDFIPAEKRTD